MTAFCFSSCSFMSCGASSALAASRSAIRRRRSVAEKVVGIGFPLFCSLSVSHQRARVAGDHQILVSLYNIGGDAAVRRADALLVVPVRRFVQLQPQPGTGPADRASNRRRILADPGGEDNSIQSAERCRKRGDGAGNAIAKQLDRKARTRIIARQKLAEIGG